MALGAETTVAECSLTKPYPNDYSPILTVISVVGCRNHRLQATSAKIPEIRKALFSVKPGVGQYIALHASPTARNCCLSNVRLPVEPSSCFFNSLQTYFASRTLNHNFTCA